MITQCFLDNWNTDEWMKIQLLESGADARALKNLPLQC